MNRAEAASHLSPERRHFLHSQDVAALSSDLLEPLFWPAERIDQPSAWWPHVPFAVWTIKVCAPRLFVELGTYTGVSYSAFCGAVARTRVGTRCYGIDSWADDEHRGCCGKEIYDDFRQFHNKHFSTFSELIRSAFDEAVTAFENDSVDLLHIVGLNTYEAVKHDYETWRSKLSPRGIVLFHDTNVAFGVGRLFTDLSEEHPHFKFLQGHGLGVIAVGADAPAAILDLCGLSSDREIWAIRDRFASLGARWFHTHESNELGGQIADLHARNKELHAAVSDQRERAADIISDKKTEISSLTTELSSLRAFNDHLITMVSELSARFARQSEGPSPSIRKKATQLRR